MAIIGTKKFWFPSEKTSGNETDNLILKNSGYISIQLKSVNVMSDGNLWQDVFGGADKLALSTTLEYQSGLESIEATSIQAVQEIKVNRVHNLGIQRNIATKIPAKADGLSLKVTLTATRKDNLQEKFELLNKSEYQQALQLVPNVVGQVITISSLVKRLFTESGPKSMLQASYAGIIAAEKNSTPVRNENLTTGHLVMISTDAGDAFENVDQSKFEVRGDTLYYDSKEVENTYMLFHISFQKYRGEDQDSNWYQKYYQALHKLDGLELVFDNNEEALEIYKEALELWMEGNGLLAADENFLMDEVGKIKTSILEKIKEKYVQHKNGNTKLKTTVNTRDLKSIFPDTDKFATSFPNTAKALSLPKDHSFIDMTIDEGKVTNEIRKELEEYNGYLKHINNSFSLLEEN